MEGTTLYCRAAKSSMWVDWRHHITPCVMMETPSVDLATGETHLLEDTIEADTSHQHLPPNNLAQAWKWLAETCRHLPAFSECSGCRLKHVCQVCYAAALHEKRQCGTLQYLCDMAQSKINHL